MSCILSQSSGTIGRIEPGFAFRVEQSNHGGDRYESCHYSSRTELCRCFSPSYLNGVLTLARDTRQFRLVAERLKSWNAAEAVSMAAEFWTKG